jgi:hypothetical protein
MIGTTSAGAAQLSARNRYIDVIPAAPPIVAQSPATVRFSLYGDAAGPTYRDVAPADGIDDERAARLRAIADRFAPLLRRNNFSIPRRFQDLAMSNTLQIDHWVNSHLDASDSIRFDRVPTAAGDDERLTALIRLIGPRRPMTAVVQPRHRDETVAFIDFPGEDEVSWRAAYDRPGAIPHTYVHYFVDEIPGVESDERYRFVIQYWFFYPFNDATNNHEGDWEHLNVLVTSMERFARDRARAHGSALTDEEVRRMVGGTQSLPIDSLVIQGVDYYFHHSVVAVDYAEAEVRPAQTPHSQHTTTHIWEDAGFTNWAVRERLHLAAGRLATHPVGYIGGQSRGPGELMRLVPSIHGSFNANSHGTYPYPGLWVSVGQLATTEELRGDITPRTRAAPADAPWRQVIDDGAYVVFGPDDFTLVPDWERIEPLVMSDAAARGRWAWLLLPLHFGFPTSPSPGGGALGRTNLGNVSPEGPAFHPGWNISGPTTEHALHPITVLRGPAAPAGPWLALQSGWGIFNLPLALGGLMPGYGVAVTTLVPYVVGVRRALGSPPTRVLFNGALPPRVTSTGYGLFREKRHLPPASMQTLNGERVWFDLYFGPRLALENTVAWSSSTAQYVPTGGAPAIHAPVIYRQLTGGLRFNLTGRETGVFQTFARGGYGWTRHDLTAAITANGDTVAGTGYREGYLPSLLPSPSWWPNSIYGGVGAELFAPKRRWILHRTGYGIRADVGGSSARKSRRSFEGTIGLVLGW